MLCGTRTAKALGWTWVSLDGQDAYKIAGAGTVKDWRESGLSCGEHGGGTMGGTGGSGTASCASGEARKRGIYIKVYW